MVQIQKGLEGKREAVLPGSALLQAEDHKTQITKYKYRHKKQQECFNFSQKHISLQIAAYYGQFCGAKRPQCGAERPEILLI